MPKAITYGFIGGIFSCILLFILFNVIPVGNDIVTVTIVLSIVICACTGVIVEKLDEK